MPSKTTKTSPDMSITDLVGQTISRGDYIVVPGRYSSSLFVSIRKVIDIVVVTPEWRDVPHIELVTLGPPRYRWAMDEPTRKGRIRELDRVFKVTPAPRMLYLLDGFIGGTLSTQELTELGTALDRDPSNV